MPKCSTLSPAGSLDSSFDCVVAATGGVSALAEQSDGKLVIGGSFTSVGGHRWNALARLNHDGTFDGTFTASLGSDSLPTAVSIQTDGKVVVAGSPLRLGLKANCVLRFNTHGTLDGSFVFSNSTICQIKCLAIQSDGRILVAGQGNSSFGTNQAAVRRVSDQGLEDASFYSGLILSGGSFPQVKALNLLPSGKIVIGGNFLTVGGASRRGSAPAQRPPRWPVVRADLPVGNKVVSVSHRDLVIGVNSSSQLELSAVTQLPSSTPLVPETVARLVTVAFALTRRLRARRSRHSFPPCQ